MNAMRASGLIPVSPRIVINKYTQLPMYIVEQAIIYCYPDWIHHSIYTSQVIYIMYCTILSTDRDLEGRRWLHMEVGRQESYRRYDISPLLPPSGGGGKSRACQSLFLWVVLPCLFVTWVHKD